MRALVEGVRRIEARLREGGGPERGSSAGSGSTGHAVLAENLADGGGRRFLLVQRGDATGEPRWPTIADITRERLRRAAEALGSEEGFRAWRLVSPGRAGSRSGTPPR